jgi:hypothetical protein
LRKRIYVDASHNHFPHHHVRKKPPRNGW